MGKKQKKKKHMTHIRNVTAIVEDKGYHVRSIRWVDSNHAIEVIIDWPQMSGERKFLKKARDAADEKN